MEKLKLKCDVLKKHILTCGERLDEISKQHEHQIHRNKRQQEESANEVRLIYDTVAVKIIQPPVIWILFRNERS
jgi:hypothetical protein